MLDDDKNLKDSTQNSPLSSGSPRDNFFFKMSYTKTNKLIAALYMVTDIIDPIEPMRAKLRTLGADIISDINSCQGHSKVALSLNTKITETLAFLEIASAIGIISEMNHNILRKEFLGLQVAIESSKQINNFYDGHPTLSEFLKDESAFTITPAITDTTNRQGYMGQLSSTRIGVQKGHSLMKALSDRIAVMSDTKNVHKNSAVFNYKIENLKVDRRKEIVSIIKNNGGDSTITDIKKKATGPVSSFSEKTLQRELSSMVSDGVLDKRGEKRWSRYSLN